MINHLAFVESKELAKIFMDLAKQILDGKLHLEGYSVEFGNMRELDKVTLKLVGKFDN